MAPRSASDVEVILDDLRASVEAILSVLSSGRDSELGERQSVGTFAEHRQLLDELARLISNNATKLAVSFSANPNAQEAQPLSDNFYQSLIALCGLVAQTPSSTGTPLREMYREAVVAVMDAALAFLTALAEGLRTNRGREQQLQTAGIVWERCGAIDSLPRDNRAAVALRLKQQQELVDDAVRELAEEYDAYKADHADGDGSDGDGDDGDGDGDDDDEWDEEAASKIPAVLGLCRATSKALQKTRTGVVPLVDEEDPENVALLDDLLESVGQLSAHTDDLVAASYAPQDAEAVSHAAVQLASAAETLLDKGRAGAGCVEIEPATEDALAFLARAVAHNLDKLHQSVTSR